MKKLNRTGLIVIIMALFSLMACLPAYAANETAAIHPSTSSASTGDVITFTVSISNVTSARGIAVIPTYDTNTFDLVSGEWLISGSLSDFSVASGDGVIALDKASDFDSAILTFSLKVKDSAPLGNATVGCAVVVSNSSGSNIPLDASDSVEIVCRHSFTKQDTSEVYLKSPADCTHKAVYYFSCEHCGDKGTETFEVGTTLEHTYNQQNTAATYLKSGATCTAKAVYYYSCICGEKGTETFESGTTLPHNYVEKVVEANIMSAADCEHPAVYYKSCNDCGVKGTDTFESGTALGHTGGTATCTEQAVCQRCGKAYGEKLAHTYDRTVESDKYLKEAKSCTHGTIYYKSCVCGEKGTETFELNDKLSHTYNQQNATAAYLKSGATCTAKAVYYFSCTCGAKGTETFEYGAEPSHSYRTVWSSNSSEHWHECSKCGDKKDTAAHVPGAEATETRAQTCTVCGYIIVPAIGHNHDYKSEWSYNSESHWHACTGCDEHKDEAVHTFDNACDTTCNVCGYTRVTAHSYKTEWSTNETEHWHECEACGDKKDVSAHTPGEWIIDKEAEVGVEGAKHKECTECGQVLEKAVIEAIPASSESETEPVTEPATEPSTEPVTEPSTEPATKPDDTGKIPTVIIIAVAAVVVIGGGVTALTIILKKRH